MTVEEQIYWCNKYWDEVKTSSVIDKHAGYKIMITGSKDGEKFVVWSYTYDGALEKLFKETLKLVFDGKTSV